MCLQGASAVEKILAAHPDPKLRVFVVWEKALLTDFRAPNTRALQRIPDRRVTQFWDKERLLSREMGEAKTGKMIWDYAAVYAHEVVWNGVFPQPSYSGRPVVAHLLELENALDGR